MCSLNMHSSSLVLPYVHRLIISLRTHVQQGVSVQLCPYIYSKENNFNVHFLLEYFYCCCSIHYLHSSKSSQRDNCSKHCFLSILEQATSNSKPHPPLCIAPIDSKRVGRQKCEGHVFYELLFCFCSVWQTLSGVSLTFF